MENFNEFIADLEKLVSINTENAPEALDAPFGENNKLALNTFLDIAKRMGFETRNYENYIGEVCFGEGEEIGIVGHLDVVPAGIGWNTPPYQLTKIGDTYYGRGTSDDKGPLLLSLYALKALKDSGIKVNKKFRLFAGCNEESGWQDAEYFSKNYGFPEYGFSPDGIFPLSYAEKGMFVVKFSLPKLKNFTNISGGTATNAVCDQASCTANTKGIDLRLINKHGLKLDGNKIVSFGLSAHGSRPDLGVNAMKALFEYFLDVGEDVQNLLDCLFYDKHGVFKQKNEQGGLTLSPNLINETEQEIIITCDVRIPAPMSSAQVKTILDKFNISYTSIEKHPPFMVEKDGWFVQALLSAYKEVSGDKNAEPIAMGGSTFGRVFEKGCSFGMDFPNMLNGIHEANEHVTEWEYKTGYEIYKKALMNLAK